MLTRNITNLLVSLVAILLAFNATTAVAAPISNPTQISGNTLWLDAADGGSITAGPGVSIGQINRRWE